MREHDEDTVGAIGTNIPETAQEKEEDLLELMAKWILEGKPLHKGKLAAEMQMTKAMLNTLFRRMVRHGYIYPPQEDQEPELTAFGRAQGMECLRRHEKIMQFIQTVSGMPQDLAQRDACRMEHVISEKALEGISRFLLNGDVYDRVFQGADLCAMYEPGEYIIRAAVYELERRMPRILAAEDARIDPYMVLEVQDLESRLLLRWREAERADALWYRADREWVRAEAVEGGVVLPARAFTFTVAALSPIVDGVLVVALTQEGQEPQPVDARELAIHIVKGGVNGETT